MSRIVDIQEFRSRIANHDITRRNINKFLASLGLATVTVPMVGAQAQNIGTDPDLMVFT